MTTNIQTPDWVKHAIFYQIFPDRFARSSRTQRPPGIAFKPWGAPPEEQGFQGGDLLGIVEKLDYLQELGITALYLNPIFSSASNHRYHTYDYFEVDPLLGGNAAFRELLDQAHARDMRIVLDGVFNHASRGFWPFHHILENGPDSPYLDWFHINGWPLRPYSTDKRLPANYEAWWDLPALPKLNTANPGVRAMIFDVARHWLDFGIDGWRLDVPGEIEDDDFWREFRQVVKSANPEAYICGEIWHPAQRWLQGDMFDAVMNYVFANHAICFFGARTLRVGEFKHPEFPLEALNAETFAEKIDELLNRYDWAINQVQMNLLDSHDMPRALWLMGGDVSALKLAVLFQMTLPGAPTVYYGDEIGLAAGTDPYCREAFPWERSESWDDELLAHYKQAAALRHQFPVLRTGTFKRLHAADGVVAILRASGEQDAIIVFNTNQEERTITIELPDGVSSAFSQAWPQGGQVVEHRQGEVSIAVPARGAVVLVT
jgi:neopullulanase